MVALMRAICGNSDVPAKADNVGNAQLVKKSLLKHVVRSFTASGTTSKRSLIVWPCWPTGTRSPAIHRGTGVKEETVTTWVEQIEPQMEQIEERLLRDHRLGRAQLDALWTYVGHKGEKKGSRKNLSAAHAGAGRRSRPTRGCASDEPSPRPKKKSPKS